MEITILWFRKKSLLLLLKKWNRQKQTGRFIFLDKRCMPLQIKRPMILLLEQYIKKMQINDLFRLWKHFLRRCFDLPKVARSFYLEMIPGRKIKNGILYTSPCPIIPCDESLRK